MRSLAGSSRGLGLLAAALGALALLIPAATFGAGEIPEIHNAKSDYDARTGTVAPTAAQLAAVEALGADARWNRFGTPSSLLARDGMLATGLAAPTAEAAAREWLAANSEIFGVDAAQLALVNDAELKDSAGHAVTFRQEFGGVPATQDGLVTVGLTGSAASGWDVAYASSSLTGDSALAGQPQLTAAQAWVAAARDAGLDVSASDITATRTEHGWTVLEARGIQGEQRTRLAAFPTATAGVAPAWETYVLSGLGSNPEAYKTFVDARSGAILFRESIVEHVHQEQPEAFEGSLPAADAGCGPEHGPYTAPPNTISVDVAATTTLPANDIVLHLKKDGVTVASFDSGTSPEAIHYEPAGGVPEGAYHVQVCDFGDGAPPLPPTSYAGTIAMNDVAGNPVPYPPKWKVFPAYPLLGSLPGDPWNIPATDIRELWCWDANVNGEEIPGCDREVGNQASRAPWDVDVRTGLPTYTTRGNNAITAEAWFSPLTPGPTGFRPFSASRSYDFPWTNAWEESDCSPTTLTPGGNDISAAVTNLFVMHNRMHDWAYNLGFDEENWNSQESNFGNGPPSHENDATIGDAQAGAVSGGWPSYTGRDNANMIPLPDGVRPITNMYLWQPLAGAFYSPCVDGDYDMAVIGHEYGHLIENRMIGKGGLRAGHHAGAMGESNGDLNGVEILREYGFTPVSGENPFAVGAYATGNKRTAIRNYGMNFPQTGAFPAPGVTPEVDPLNFSDIGYDITHAQVHADGEIWSATNYDIRQALVTKYNAQFPESDVALQRDCADGINPPGQCPGNRRWAQLMYDAYLLMPVAPSMLDARDAYLAADKLRFGGANQLELWGAFAKRGFGEGAHSTNNSRAESDTDPKPDFASPLHNEATVTFRAVAPDEGNAVISNARILVGHYEARVSPVADTDPATNAPAPGANNLDDVATFVPGTYEFVVQARGYGHLRLRRSFAAGRAYTVTISFPTNWASSAKGATAAGDGTRLADLIDDTEATNWESTGVPVSGRQVTVDLGGGSRVVRRVQVSAMLRTNPGFPDPVTQNRFTALRQFEIWTCDADQPASANCTLPTAFTRIYTSPGNAFPGGNPRPLAPNLILRDFDVPDTRATHVRIVVLANQCTGNPSFQGDQEADPASNSDCRLGTAPLLVPRDKDVRIAELQVFNRS